MVQEYSERDSLLQHGPEEKRTRQKKGHEGSTTQRNENKEEIEEINIPERMKCPITKEIMNNPVIAEDSTTYEKKAILRWLKDHNTSPTTRELISPNVIKNRVVYRQIQTFKKKHKDYFEQTILAQANEDGLLRKEGQQQENINETTKGTGPTTIGHSSIMTRIKKLLERRNIHSQVSAMALLASVLTIACLPTTIITFCIVIIMFPNRNNLWTISISLANVANMFLTAYMNIFSWTSRLKLIRLRYNFAGTSLGGTFWELWVGLLNLAMTSCFSASLLLTKHAYILEYISVSFLCLSFASTAFYIMATIVVVCLTFGLRIRNYIMTPINY